MLALHGFDVYGLDVSGTGVAIARAYTGKELEAPQAHNFGKAWSPAESKEQTTGEIALVEGDFFQSGWEPEAPFDLIYDYTVQPTSYLSLPRELPEFCSDAIQFLCALHPSMRAQWAMRMGELLAPTGMLVCLEFPLYKDLKLPGPPWGLKGVYWDLLVEGGLGIVSSEGEFRSRGQGKGQFRRMLYVKPARSYENGRGTDMISVYIKRS